MNRRLLQVNEQIRRTSHFHGRKYSSRRHRFSGINRFAQLSRYARGSLASLMASREAAIVIMSEGPIQGSTQHTWWCRVGKADGRLYRLCDCHDAAIEGVGELELSLKRRWSGDRPAFRIAALPIQWIISKQSHRTLAENENQRGITTQVARVIDFSRDLTLKRKEKKNI